jgi:hypothetical protein
MARKISTVLIDDLDGSVADSTIHFSLDGAHYEIDLNAEHASELRDALAPYVNAGRRRSAANLPQRPGRTSRRPGSGGTNPTDVREWAKAHGMEVNDRGRVPAELMVKFKEAGGK